MNIEYNYYETDKRQMRGFISRYGNNFVCNVHCHKGFDTEENVSKLNEAMKKYIDTKSVIKLDENYVGTWEKLNSSSLKKILKRFCFSESIDTKNRSIV